MGRRGRQGCGRWLLYGVIGLAVLMGCGVLASVMAPSQRETPARVVPTWTNTPVPPTETPAATATATLLPTSTPVPTETPMPAPVIEERAAPVLVLPTATASGPPCDCGGDQYSCKQFPGHSEAQACFEYCMAIGAGDIHRLDGDGDGFVCED